MIDDVNDTIRQNIVSRASKGKVIKTDAVIAKLDDLKQFYSNTIDPQPFLDDINALADRVKTVHGKTIPLDKAQAIKQTTYALIRKHYGEMKSLNIEAQKALARGIKDEIVRVYPEIANLNAKDSALINLQDSLERAVGRITNRDIMGIGVPIKTTAGAVQGKPGALAGLTMGLIDTPTIKARLALALSKAKKIKTPTKITPRQAITQGAYIGGTVDNVQ